MSHHQLRFDLLHRIHGDAHDDQQRGASEGKLNAHAIQQPGGQAVEVPPDDRQMVNPVIMNSGMMAIKAR